MKLWSYICGIIICLPTLLFAQGTVFTYQGSLMDGVNPANGSYLLTFRLFDAAIDGHQIGTNGPSAISVSNGMFTATLDFGVVFTGTNYWLEIAVQKDASPTVTLSPRQPITTVPYAQMAGSAATLTGKINLTSSDIPDLSGIYTTRTNNLSDLNSAAAARTNLGVDTNFYALLNDARPLSLTNTNNSFVAFNINAVNLSLAANNPNYGGFAWNGTAFVSPGTPSFSLFLNRAHGGGFDGSELQLTFNQMYFGPVTGGHVQFGLSGDFGDTFYFNRQAHLSVSNGWSSLLGFHLSWWPTGFSGPELTGKWNMHATNYDAAHGYSFLRFLWTGTDNGEDGSFADGQTDKALRLNSAGYAEFTDATRSAATNASAGTNFNINFNSKDAQIVTLTSAVTFRLINLSITNQSQSVDLWIYPGPVSWGTIWPANILWESDSGTAVEPSNTPGAFVSHVRLTAVYGMKTNVFGHVWLAPYAAAYDSDASNYFAASGITNATQRAAVNQLVVDLKDHSLWSKLDCIYPFVGGTSNSHSWNLKDTSKYRIAWTGGVTQDLNGVTGDGTTGFGDTQFNPSAASSPNYTQNSASYGVYNKTASPVGAVDPAYIGAVDRSSHFATLRYVSPNISAIGPNDASSLSGVANAVGLLIVTRTGVNLKSVYVNTTNNSDNSTGSTGVPNATFYICAEDNGGLFKPSSANLAFAFIGSALSSSDESQLNTDVLNFETTLGRQ